jgi:hypothetical protein
VKRSSRGVRNETPWWILIGKINEWIVRDGISISRGIVMMRCASTQVLICSYVPEFVYVSEVKGSTSRMTVPLPTLRMKTDS